MKKALLILLTMSLSSITIAQQYKVITIVESIVPGGLGRSRIVENTGEINVEEITTQREGEKSKSGDIKRSDIKDAGDNLKETKLLNFYSIAGINFGNIAANDAVIAAKMNEMIKLGWKVAYVTSAVESDAGKDDPEGIFITRIFFTKD